MIHSSQDQVVVSESRSGDPPSKVDHAQCRGSSRPIILAILARIAEETESGSIRFDDLERLVRREAQRLIPSGQVEKDFVDLMNVMLVEVDESLRCRATNDGLSIGEGLRILLKS